MVRFVSGLPAATGTIAFMMDCDTTGIEPDIALVKYKKLVGGGLLKIVNQTVPEALRRLGYTPATADEIVDYIDKNETIEGAPALKEEHLSIFDCAFKAMNGTRSIHYMGYIKMMVATQAFISGAISKTVNMPEHCTVDEIMQAYIESWKLGLKAVAIYRDNSKRTQPLSTMTDVMKAEGKEKDGPRAVRRKLLDERQAITHKFSIAGQERYFTVGLYEDGSPGEIFIKMSKEGSTISGLMDSFAVAVSMCLQYGVPLRVLVNKFAHTRFEPSGYTANKEIPIAKSLMDYIFRWFDLRFHPSGDNGHIGKEVHTIVAQIVPSLSALGTSTQPALPTSGNNGDDLNSHLAHLQQDAPPCSECGTIMTRSGACYKCSNCGYDERLRLTAKLFRESN
jgi:ribonucleoside-diphosphate reductase alpha chain